jgi:glycosyltransferase involved in cell wall biosynthesis
VPEITPGLVSTIIPTFNRSGMLVEAVQSVLNQTHRQLEVIIVDDGSTDETPTVVSQLQKADLQRVKYIRQVNAGPGGARNAGFQIAAGEFIQYLDCDDVLHPDKFAKQVQSLRSNPSAGISYCITLREDPETKQFVNWARTAEKIENIFPSFLPTRGWATLTPLWRRSVCEAVGPWKLFRLMEDWEYDLRAGFLGVLVVGVPEPLCTIRDHEGKRLSGMNEGWTLDRVRYFYLAHESVWIQMRQQGHTNWQYLQQYSRTMFWIARLCGAHGLFTEANVALDYVDEMTSVNNLPSSTRVFRCLTKLIGWTVGIWLAEKGTGIRRRR